METSDDFRCKLKIEGSGYKLYLWVHVRRLKPRALLPDRLTDEKISNKTILINQSTNRDLGTRL